MILRKATKTEINQVKAVFSGNQEFLPNAIFFETTKDSNLLSSFKKEFLDELFVDFWCSLGTGIFCFTDKEVEFRDYPAIYEPGAYRCNTRLNIVRHIRSEPENPLLSFSTSKSEYVVEIDNKSIPNDLQLNALDNLPMSMKAWEDVHGLTRRLLLMRGWVVVENRLASITDAGKAALERKQYPEKIVPEMVVSPKQIEAFTLLAVNKNAVNDLHGIVVHNMVKASWINPDGTFQPAGVEMLGKLNIEMTGNEIVENFVPVETNDEIIVTVKQREALVLLAGNKSAVTNIHKKTKNYMIREGWINVDGSFTPAGAALVTNLEIEIKNNEIKNPEKVEVPQDAYFEGTVNKIEEKTEKEIKLTPVQIEFFHGKTPWKTLHGKTQNFMIKQGWVTESGKFTETGLSIKNNL